MYRRRGRLAHQEAWDVEIFDDLEAEYDRLDGIFSGLSMAPTG